MADRQSFSIRLFHNVFFRLISAVWIKGIGIVAVPYIVHSLGAESYGIYTLCLLILSYFTFLDLGFGNALVKYFSEYRSVGRHEELEDVVRVTMWMNLVAGVIGGAMIWALSGSVLLRLLKIPEANYEMASAVFKMIAVAFVVSMASGAAGATLQALQRFDVLSVIEIISATISTGGIVAILLTGGNLFTVVVFYLIMCVLIAVAFFTTIKVLLPDVSFMPKYSSVMFRKLFFFGIYNVGSRAASLFVFHIDKFIISALLSVAAVTYYVIPNKLAAIAMQFPIVVMPIIFPAVSELHATGEHERMRRLFLRGLKYVLILVLPVVLPLTLIPEAVLGIWVGREFAEGGMLVLILLSISHLAASLTMVPGTLVSGIGRPQVQTFFLFVAGIINVAACLLLVPRYGIVGAAWASVISITISGAGFFIYMQREMRIGFREILGEKFISLIVLAAVVGVVLRLFRGEITDVASLLAAIFVTGVCFIGLVLLFRVIDRDERRLISDYLALRVKKRQKIDSMNYEL
ncbi:MAG: flippase [bacterium]